MVGFHGMAPAPIDLSDRIEDPEAREEAEERGEGALRAARLPAHAPLGLRRDGRQPVRRDAGRPRQAAAVAGLLGQAFVVAWNTVQLNREGTQHVAERLISAGELYGDDVTDLLDGAVLRKPAIDVTDEATWPAI